MKVIITLIVILGAVTYANANDWRSTCDTYSNAAEKIMEGRQKGVSMRLVMESVEGNKLLEELVIQAYGRSRFSTPEVQKKAIDRFRDEVYHECVIQLRESGDGSQN